MAIVDFVRVLSQLIIVVLPTASLLFDNSGISILYIKSESVDNVGFREAISDITGGQVDYFDASSGTPSVDLLQTYDCAMVHTRGSFSYDSPIAMGDTLADYVDQGGTVVFSDGTTQALQGRILEPDYSPVIVGQLDECGPCPEYAGDGFTLLYDGVSSFTSIANNRDTDIFLQGDGIQDGSYSDGVLAAAYRPDFLVVYLSGTYCWDSDFPNLNCPDGDHPQRWVNACSVAKVPVEPTVAPVSSPTDVQACTNEKSFDLFNCGLQQTCNPLDCYQERHPDGFDTCQEAEEICPTVVQECCPACEPEFLELFRCTCPQIECNLLASSSPSVEPPVSIPTPVTAAPTFTNVEACINEKSLELVQCGARECPGVDIAFCYESRNPGGVDNCEEAEPICRTVVQECCPGCAPEFLAFLRCECPEAECNLAPSPISPTNEPSPAPTVPSVEPPFSTPAPIPTFPTSTPDEYFLIKSTNYEGCIEPRGGVAIDDETLILGPCSLGWRYDANGLLHSQVDDSKCIQAARGGTIEDGSKVRIFPCDATRPDQVFSVGPSQALFLESRPDLCVVFLGVNAMVNQDPIILKNCTAIEADRLPWDSVALFR